LYWAISDSISSLIVMLYSEFVTAYPFCNLEPSRAWLETECAIALLDAFPVTDGHTLVVPRKHVRTIYELTVPEQQEIWEFVRRVRERLLAHFKPDAFNIGLNDGPAPGQTVEHAHVHLIPRRLGDVSDPRGGIRWVLADKARY
jgi:diadenosine tetraphosphate (Ap4A) HIT family hydrolase